MNKKDNYRFIEMALLTSFLSLCILLAGLIIGISSCGFGATNGVSNNIERATNVGIIHYISPKGSDSNSGTSTAPWQTWSYALKQLKPGHTLIVKKGTWTNGSSCSGLPTPCLANTALPNINCASRGNAKNGTATQHITIIAENERRAYLRSNGSTSALRVDGCSYWDIKGLRGQSADLSRANGGAQYSIFEIDNSNNITLKRLLSTNNNRWFNDAPYAFYKSNNSLIEESEAYYFHRHGISIQGSPSITVRRCYVNSRGYADLPNCNSSQTTNPFCSINPTRGDEGITCYPTEPNPSSYNCLIENSISEGNNLLSIGDGTAAQPNRLLGSISLNDVSGLFTGGGNNVVIKNSVVIGGKVGLYLRSIGGGNVSNVTVYGARGTGVIADKGPNDQTLLTPGFTMTNILSFGNSESGFSVDASYYTGTNWEIDFSNAGEKRYNPSSSKITSSMNTAPTLMGLGNNQCIVYVPSNSNMKGEGKNGADIGANIIYRYEDGVLNNQKLWDQTIGQFPCGATVAGVNDDATFPSSSCVNVHKRLNVGVNGCPIP